MVSASTSTSPPVLFLLFFFMLFTTEATAKKNHSSVIQLGSWLAPEGKNTSWLSSSGHFAFGFYPQRGKNNNFAVGIWLVSPSENTTTTVVWTANRDSPTVSSNSTLNLTMQGLLLRNGKEEEYYLPYNFESEDSDSEAVASASMHDSGNFVLYDKHFNVLWQSFDYPTDTILGGQNLTSDDELVSSMSQSDHSNGRFYLKWQTAGNFVAYPSNSSEGPMDAYWASNTLGALPPQLSLYDEDSLCVDNNSNSSNKSPNTTSIYRATLEVDGDFVLYEHRFEGNTQTTHVKKLWQAMNDKCEIKGFCGLNSYCSNKRGDAVCECFPGFIISSKTKTSSNNMSLDCVQTHSKDDCENSEDPLMLYNVTHFENMTWGDIPYSVMRMPMKKKEICEKACREDCDCGGAFYISGKCNKYRLPLIYARFQNDSFTVGVALLKIRSGILISPPPASNNTDVPKPVVVVDNKRSLIMILAFTLGCVSFICLVFAVSVFFTYRRQVYKYAMLSEGEKLGFTEEEYSLRSFSFDELVKSTKGFTEEIGSGSFGAVYSGTIGESNKRIAVKRLERIADEGEREFRAEITAIARTHHRNLVKLVGFCIDGSKKLLVYEYLSNGSLANLLFQGGMRLFWKERMKIALDVARGLLYLHEECEVRIIHCNIKPGNILMDEAWTAKISDFGLARLLKRDYYSRTKNGEDDGKSGYLAPEWQKEDASVSVKADIYSFGIVLLEIVCRRSSIEKNVSSADQILLSSWVCQCFAAGQLSKLIRHEEEEEEEVDWKIVERMVKVGLWCVQDHPSLRPSMKNVILMLEGLKDIPVPPSPARLIEI